MNPILCAPRAPVIIESQIRKRNVVVTLFGWKEGCCPSGFADSCSHLDETRANSFRGGNLLDQLVRSLRAASAIEPESDGYTVNACAI
jgi:hypothetical protein